MRKLTKISALSLLFLSGTTLAAKNDCLIIMVGGGKEWPLFKPAITTDISILVDKEAKAAANKTGCKIISGHNQSPEEFKEMIRKAGRPPYYKPGTTVHMTFTDHGTPQPKDGKNGNLYIGVGTTIRHADLAEILKTSFPKGSRLTFGSSICWGSLSEMVTYQNLDSHFDVCGGTSTHPSYVSMNMMEISRGPKGIKSGPYVAVGLDAAASNPNLTVAEYHATGKFYDLANLYRMPGFLSSTTYARMILKEKGIEPLIDDHPLESLIETSVSINNIDSMVEKFSEIKLQDDIANVLKNGDDCTLNTDPSFHSFVKSVGTVFKTLSGPVPSSLPQPYRGNSSQAALFLKYNKKDLPRLLSKFYKAKMDFWAKNKTRALDPKQSAALKAEWKEMAIKLKRPLKTFLYHSRVLQEGRTVADFLAVASKQQRARFNKFVACESRPLL